MNEYKKKQKRTRIANLIILIMAILYLITIFIAPIIHLGWKDGLLTEGMVFGLILVFVLFMDWQDNQFKKRGR